MLFDNKPMRLLTEEEKNYYIYDNLYKTEKTLESVLINGEFHNVCFEKGYGMFEGKFFIKLCTYSYGTNTSIKTGITYGTVRPVKKDIYEVDKDFANNLYRQIKGTMKMSKNNKPYYRWGNKEEGFIL